MVGPQSGEPTMSNAPTILYTLTDEAPALATRSLLPIVSAYAATAGIAVETRDISLSGRMLAQFPELLSPTSSSCPTSALRSRSSKPR